MTSHSAIAAAGLVLDIAGALFLAWGLISKPPERALHENASTYGGSNFALDVSLALQKADAQAGALLLIAGFAGQLAGALGWDQHSSWTAVGTAIAAAAVVDVVAGVVLCKAWRPRCIREMLVARMRADDLGRWWPALSIYGGLFSLESDGGVTETVEAFGRRIIGDRRWTRAVNGRELPLIYTRLRRDVPGTDEYVAAYADDEASAC